jgi:hypothetical protein
MKAASISVLLSKWTFVLVAVLAGIGFIFGCQKVDTGNESLTEFGRLIADRPLPDLTRLADRSSPSYQYKGEDVMGSFYDILKLREVGDKKAVPVLEKILVEHAGSTRIHGFAAAQALFCIGTSDAHRILAKHLLSSRYNAQLSINYAYHCEMAEPKRSRFIKRYHLQNLSKDLALKLKAKKHEDKDGQLIDLTVILHNVSGEPLEFWDKQVYLGQMLYFQTLNGRFARTRQTVVYNPPSPRTRKLLPGATHEYKVSVRVKDVDLMERRMPSLSEDAEIVACTSDIMFDIRKGGRFKVYAMFEQQPLPQTQINQLGLKNPWSGRAVSKPITVRF